ncbi:MAG: PQQ-binding-like beta-propeller repeat protein, partial [Halieaceae bacterium]
YSSSVVALHASTGEVAWHFQTVHHDIWDYDVPSQPTLYDVTMDGKPVKALAQTTKMGYIFLLDRATGEPLFPVEERPVPQGAVPGDYTSPTQPFPTKPPTLLDTKFGPDDVWGLTPWDRNACRERLEGLRADGLFTPPSVEGSLHFPSAVGGQNWGGPSVDMQRKVLVVNTLHMASLVQLIPREQCEQAAIDRKNDPLQKKFATIEPSEGTPYCDLRWVGFFSPLELPCSPPPWGTIAGIDLSSGDLLWQVPLGTTRDLAPFPAWFIKGVPNTGGPMSTASGLTFIAATTDFFLRAFDTMTGEELWSARLPTGGHATPMSYQSESGKQYVVIAAGGHYSFGTPPSDHIIAFAIEDD